MAPPNQLLNSPADAVLNRLVPLPVEDLILHETVEPRRLGKVARSLTKSGTLKNPVLATAMPDGKFLVIDGAHRVSALRSIGVELALAQIFEPGECQVSAWHHLVPIQRMPVEVDELLEAQCPACLPGAAGAVGNCVAVTHLPGGSRHVWCDSSDVGDIVALLHKLVSSYAAAGHAKRISPEERVLAKTLHRRLRVAYQPLTLNRLHELASRGLVLPAGITRFITPGRVLGANIPLSLLFRKCDSSATERIRCHVGKLSLRYYAEPVFLVE